MRILKYCILDFTGSSLQCLIEFIYILEYIVEYSMKFIGGISVQKPSVEKYIKNIFKNDLVKVEPYLILESVGW